jgi:hypothetical protein
MAQGVVKGKVSVQRGEGENDEEGWDRKGEETRCVRERGRVKASVCVVVNCSAMRFDGFWGTR